MCRVAFTQREDASANAVRAVTSRDSDGSGRCRFHYGLTTTSDSDVCAAGHESTHSGSEPCKSRRSDPPADPRHFNGCNDCGKKQCSCPTPQH